MLAVAFLLAIAPQPSMVLLTSASAISDSDPVAERDKERAHEARWFILGASSDEVLMVDRRTIQHEAAERIGWIMRNHFQSGKVDMRAAIKFRWDCSARAATRLVLQTFDANGTPDPMDTSPQQTEPIVPDSIIERASDYVCDRPIRSSAFPMPVNRDPVSAAQILAAYVDHSELSVLGMLFASLDPEKDKERLRSLLEIERPDKKVRLEQLIWGDNR